MFRVYASNARGGWRWLEPKPGRFVHGGFIMDAEAATLAALEARGRFRRVLVIDGEGAIALELEDGRCTWPPALATAAHEHGNEAIAAALRRRIAEKAAGAMGWQCKAS